MRRKSFRPAMDAMEPRIALSSSSSWFNNLVDSLFGQSTTSSSSSTTHLTAAQVAHVKAERQARQEQIAELRQEHSLRVR